jgi:hypothetical protein
MLVASFAIAAGLSGSAWAAPPGPARIAGEVAALVSSIDAAGGAEVAFVATASSLNFIRGRAWILSLTVRDAPAYGGEFFVLSEIDGRLVGELLRTSGPGGTLALTGEELTSYLSRVELDHASIRAAFERYYRRRP